LVTSNPGTVSSCDFLVYGNFHSSVSKDELKEKNATVNGEVPDNDHLESPNTHGPESPSTRGPTAIVKEDSSPTRRGMVLPFLPLSLVFDNIVDMPPVR
jgi:hypothetical protein